MRVKTQSGSIKTSDLLSISDVSGYFVPSRKITLDTSVVTLGVELVQGALTLGFVGDVVNGLDSNNFVLTIRNLLNDRGINF